MIFTGKKCVQKISGLVSKVLCYDAFPAVDWIKTIPNAEYVSLDQLLSEANIISIHVPLLPETHHMINEETIAKMQKNVILVNTSRGEIGQVRHQLLQTMNWPIGGTV